MRIGIVSNFNPSELKEYLYERQEIPDTKVMASSVQALVTGFLKQGHHVVVFTPCSSKFTLGRSIKILEGTLLKIYLVRCLPKIDCYIKHLYMPQKLARCIKLEVGNLDVLHAQWTYECSVATLGFVERLPVFCSVRDWWPVIYDYYKDKTFKMRLLWGWCNRHMFIKTMNNTRIHFVANSEYTRHMIISMFPNYNVPIIPNPIKEQYIIKDKDYYFNNVFIMIADDLLAAHKNIYVLLKAFHVYYKHNSQSKLLLVGGYNREHELYKRAKSENLLEGVEFCGRLPHAQVIEKLDESSVMIHPSLEETYGNILLEGMARRLLVIGGEKSGAVPIVLGQGKYGKLCSVNDPESIYKAMSEVETEIEKVREIVNRATEHLCANLTDVAVARAHVDLYTNKANFVSIT